MRFYKFESRKDWTMADSNYSPTEDQLKLGAILRIADATEAMAKNHVELMAERDSFKRLYQNSNERLVKRDRTIAGLRGVITKLKGKK